MTMRFEYSTQLLLVLSIESFPRINKTRNRSQFLVDGVHDYKKFPDLREECIYQGLIYSRTKRDLIQRLAAADKEAGIQLNVIGKKTRSQNT